MEPIDIIRRKLNQIISKNIDEIAVKFVCPIYFKIDDDNDENNKNGNKYEGNGSGFCIKFNENFYLITAAHCLYENDLNIIDKSWIYSDKEKQIICLDNKRVFNKIYLGNHKTQDDDIAIFQIISDEEYFDYFEILDNYLNLSIETIGDHIYYGVALGFPSNKNQSKDVFRHRGKYAQSHGSISKLDQKTLNDLEIAPNKNIVLSLGDRTYTENETFGNFINHEGMSGGGLFAYIIVCNPENQKICGPCLLGLIIEHQKPKNDRFIIAISMQEIISKIKETTAE